MLEVLEARYLLSGFSAIPFTYNENLQITHPDYPSGELNLGGVPFSIPESGDSAWAAHYDGPNPHTLDVDVEEFGVDQVFTLINTGWGQPGPDSYAALEFFGSDGAYFRKDLIGNVDIRDWNEDGFTNSINGATTTNVWSTAGEQHRIDMQRIDLPPEFLTQTLTTIQLSDTGDAGFQRVLLVGLTVEAVGDNLAPNPGFELGTDVYGTPLGWHRWGGPVPNPVVGVQRDAEVARAGSYSMRVTNEAGNQRYAASDVIPIDATQQHLLKAWVRTDDNSQVKITLAMLDENRLWIGDQWRLIDTRDQWSYYGLTVTDLKSGTAYVQISLSADSGNREGGIAWYDDVSLIARDDLFTTIELAPDPSTWAAFPLDWRDSGETVTDMSFLLDGPTGKHGFLTTGDDGHFYFEDGTRARFWGTNIHSVGAAFPQPAEAESFAARLARQGVNMVRIHLLENDAPYGLIDPSSNDVLRLSESQLAKLDYLIYQFHLRGIYLTLDALPMEANTFRRDGQMAYGLPPEILDIHLDGGNNGADVVTHFDPQVIGLARQYAVELFNHVNPYTQKRYADDPTIALVEMTNEDNMFRFFDWWNHLPERYVDELRTKWDEWSERPEGAEFDNQLGAAGPDWQRFLAWVQTDFYVGARAFLRNEIGLRVPITGSNSVEVSNYGRVAYPALHLSTHDVLDFVDDHDYWDHLQRDENGNQVLLTNVPMVTTDPLSTETLVSGLSFANVAGQPSVATEWTTMWPNQFRAADVLATTAYSLLQDKDAIYIYSYYGGYDLTYYGKYDGQIPYATVLFADPAQAGLFPAAAAMFLRHDVAAARNVVDVSYSEQELIDPTVRAAAPQSFVPYLSRHQQRFPASQSTDANVTIPFGGSASNMTWELSPDMHPEDAALQFTSQMQQWGLYESDQGWFGDWARSDTGELYSNWEDGLVSIDTARTQSASGFLGQLATAVTLQDVTFDAHTDFATLTLTSLDDDPIASASRILLTAVGRAENTGQTLLQTTLVPGLDDGADVQFKPTAELIASGEAPVLIEPIEATVTIQRAAAAPALRVYALDRNGQRIEEVSVQWNGDQLQFDIGAGRDEVGELQATIYYELVNDFGAIQGMKFEDVNGNGVRDLGEPGLDGWTIQLLDNTGDVVASTVTKSTDLDGDGIIDPWGEKGLYAFVDLPPATYVVSEVPQEHWVQTSDEGRSLANFADFADLSQLTLNGATAEINRLGIEFDGQPVLRLTNDFFQSGSAFRTDPVYSKSGRPFSFETDFAFQITNPGDLGAPSDAEGAGADGVAFVLANSPTSLGELGEGLGYAGIGPSLVVEFDTFNNDNFGSGGDGDNGNHVGISINGDRVAVTQYNVPTAMNNGEVWHAWIDYDGRSEQLEVRLSESSVRPDAAALSFSVDLVEILGQEPAYAGFTSGTGLQSNDHDIRSWNFATLASSRVILSSGDVVTNLDIGNFQLATLQGQKYEDMNANGQQDADEPGLNGWIIEVYDQARELVASVVTNDVDADGDGEINPLTERGLYSVSDLPPGIYTIREVSQEGWMPAATPIERVDVTFGFGEFADLSSLSLNGATEWINLDPVLVDGQAVLRLTDNVLQSGSALLKDPIRLSPANPISFSTDFAFQIANSGPEGFPLDDGDGPAGDGFAFLVSTAATALGGLGEELGYGGIGPSLIVEFDTFNNDLFGSGGDGNNGNHVGISLNGDRIAVAQYNVPTPMNNGELWHAWIDYDGTLQMLEVWLSQSSTRPETPVLSYHVDLPSLLGQEEVFVGFSAGTGLLYSDHDILTWNFKSFASSPAYQVISSSGEIVSDLDFGNFVPASIQGYKFEDFNHNGLDDEEPRVSGVAMTLTGDADGDGALDTLTTITDSNGEYRFKDLWPGLYTVEETVPMGWVPTTPISQTVSVFSRDELVALPGQTMSPSGVLHELAFGNRLANYAPVSRADGPYVENEGEFFQLDASASMDLDEPNSSLTFAWDLDYDGFTFDVDTTGAQPTVVFADNFAPRLIAVRVTDSGGLSDIATSTLEIKNVRPEITGGGHNAEECGNLSAGDDVTLSVAFRDPGFDDSAGGTVEDFTTSTIDWGDGTVETVPAITVSESPGSPGVFTTGAVSGSHAYNDGGIYTITVTIVDDDGGSAQFISTAFVSGVGFDTGTGILYIIGTPDDDHVSVNKQGNKKLKVHADFLPNGNFKVIENASDIEKIIVYLCEGDDHLTIAGNITIPAIIHGGGGDDHLNAGGGPTVLLGDTGNDMLVGGGGGRDLIIGGLGQDRLVGGKSDDVLIGGSTTDADDAAALMTLLAAWTSTDNYDDRVAAIDLLLSVEDDEEEDLLTGSSGRDLFYDGLGDTLTDRKTKKDPETVR